VAESLGGFGGATPAVKYPVQIWTPSLAARVTAGGADTALAAPAPDCARCDIGCADCEGGL
jgi:hypothetical protein